MTPTDTPRTDTCPHCRSEWDLPEKMFACGTPVSPILPYGRISKAFCSERCDERSDNIKLKAEVEELNRLMLGWKQRATMSEMDLEASKAEVERLTSALKSYWHSATWRAEIGRNAQATAFTKD